MSIHFVGHNKSGCTRDDVTAWSHAFGFILTPSVQLILINSCLKGCVYFPASSGEVLHCIQWFTPVLHHTFEAAQRPWEDQDVVRFPLLSQERWCVYEAAGVRLDCFFFKSSLDCDRSARSRMSFNTPTVESNLLQMTFMFMWRITWCHTAFWLWCITVL